MIMLIRQNLQKNWNLSPTATKRNVVLFSQNPQKNWNLPNASTGTITAPGVAESTKELKLIIQFLGLGLTCMGMQNLQKNWNIIPHLTQDPTILIRRIYKRIETYIKPIFLPHSIVSVSRIYKRIETERDSPPILIAEDVGRIYKRIETAL